MPRASESRSSFTPRSATRKARTSSSRSPVFGSTASGRRLRWKQNIFPVHLVDGPPVLDVLRRLRHGERELVEILHRRHGCDTRRRGGVPERSNGEVLKTSEPSGSVSSNLTPAAFARWLCSVLSDDDGRRSPRVDAALAARCLDPQRRRRRRPDGRDRLLARLALARAATGGRLHRQGRLLLRAAAQRRQVRGQPAGLRTGGARAALRRRLPADRPLAGCADPRGPGGAADRGSAWLDRGRDEGRGGRRRPHLLHRRRPRHRARPVAPGACLSREHVPQRVIEAVVFDLDGVLLQSEEVWDAVRERYVRERGGRYDDEVQRAMMGMSAPEWSRFLHEEAGVPDDMDEINSEVVRRMLEAYRRELPLLPGAVETVRRIADAFPLALASSSNREVFEEVLELAGLAACFRATVSSEEVERGKPAPDVYLEAARRLGVEPTRCAAVDDSHAGIRAAKSAGMRVVAIPNAAYPPDEEAVRLADALVGSLDELTVDILSRD